jgi:hypothetical protein
VVVVLRMTSLACRFFLQRGYQCRLRERNKCLIYGFDNVRAMLMDVIYEVRLSRTVRFVFNFVIEFSAIHYCLKY